MTTTKPKAEFDWDNLTMGHPPALTDKHLLLMAYGALKAMAKMEVGSWDLVKIIELHLWPEGTTNQSEGE